MVSGLEVGGHDRVLAKIDGRHYVCAVDAGELKISNEQGDELSATSAQVLMSLGGAEPEWLTSVEALSEAFAVAEGPPLEAVQVAASALEQKNARRAEIARTTTDPAVLVALAAVGTTQVGANPACSVRAWDLLMKCRDPTVRRKALRSNEVLPPSLWKYKDVETRLRVARNPTCPDNVLWTLAKLGSEYVPVRTAVASNPHAPTSLLTTLAADDEVGVRRAVASNSACPVACFKQLSRDRWAVVRTSVVLNPSMPVRRVARRIWTDPTPSVHVALGSRVDLRPRNLVWLERYSRSDPVSQYRLACERIANHPACSQRLGKRIAARQAHLDALPQEKLAALESVRVQKGQKLPSGILATTLLVSAAVAVGGGFIAGGIQEMRISTLGGGLPLVVVGVIACVGLLLLARRVYRRSPARGMIAPPRPRSVLGPLVVVLLLGVMALGAASIVRSGGLVFVIIIVVRIVWSSWLRSKDRA